MVNLTAHHAPVMLSEVLEYLAPKPGEVIVDATLGLGGHSQAVLERLSGKGRLIGIDRDADSLQLAQQFLQDKIVELVQANFAELDLVLKRANLMNIDGILFDLGVSSFQLDNPQRGFSFKLDGPLDMRFDQTSFINAFDLVNTLSRQQLEHLLRSFGQERFSRRIAQRIVETRQQFPITTTKQLADIVVSAIPLAIRNRSWRIHPATRTFQALRIAVNRELEALDTALDKAINYLNKGGRIVVISFHSLEDRIVKWMFKKKQQERLLDILTPKPITAKQSEIEHNPRARSAKLRAARKR
ncbi:MAG: 16S rRNA (cytosine(1402)-N(4))-methyltransferase RsmH [Candidatus Omnitrophica bacterium]|nr:16S rRNA (cytosine(1402)-N(4))-methyltransferase RsmH [Candidatus Omnitrophota bacterium]